MTGRQSPGASLSVASAMFRDYKLAELRREIAIGVDQADRGQVQPFNEETTARVKAGGRSRLNAQNGLGQA